MKMKMCANCNTLSPISGNSICCACLCISQYVSVSVSVSCTLSGLLYHALWYVCLPACLPALRLRLDKWLEINRNCHVVVAQLLIGIACPRPETQDPRVHKKTILPALGNSKPVPTQPESQLETLKKTKITKELLITRATKHKTQTRELFSYRKDRPRKRIKENSPLFHSSFVKRGQKLYKNMSKTKNFIIFGIKKRGVYQKCK